MSPAEWHLVQHRQEHLFFIEVEVWITSFEAAIVARRFRPHLLAPEERTDQHR